MDLKSWINPSHLQRQFDTFDGLLVLDDFLTPERNAGLSEDVQEKLTFTEIYGRYGGRQTQIRREI